jgi:hypothetical protein
MSVINGGPTIRHVMFVGNVAAQGGGGMANLFSSAPSLFDVAFSNNTANSGGAIYNYHSSPQLLNVVFSGNTASIHGGALSNNTSSPSLVNVAFFGHSAVEGGAIYSVGPGSPSLVNVTFGGNSASNYGGAIFNRDGNNPTLVNAILWGNTAVSGGNEIWNDLATPHISYSVFPSTGIGGTWTDGGNNVNANPMFVDAPNGNLRLDSFDSPAVDAGSNVAIAGIGTDLDGNPRVSHDVVDIGAYEFQVLTSVDPDRLPRPFQIVSISPNPFNPSASIHFTLPAATLVEAQIYSVTGARVKVLSRNERFAAGDNRLAWDGRDDRGAPVASGVYFVRIETRLGAKVARAVLLK